jgi:hypothetical protein
VILFEEQQILLQLSKINANFKAKLLVFAVFKSVASLALFILTPFYDEDLLI